VRLRWPRVRAARAAATMNRKVRRGVWLGFEGGKGEALGTRLVCEVASRVQSVEEEDSERHEGPTCRRTCKNRWATFAGECTTEPGDAMSQGWFRVACGRNRSLCFRYSLV
jgi:ribosomal protein L37AE/L43A